MALSLLLSSVQACDCKTLTLTDATGVYNVSTNPTGWGSPNTVVSGVTCAHLKITLPDHLTVYYVDVTSVFTAAAGDSSLLVFTLTGASIGLTSSDQIPDGVYTIEYSVFTGASTFGVTGCSTTAAATSTTYIPLYCVVQCCILSKISLIPQYYCCDACNNAYVEYCFDLWMMLKALQTAEVSVSYLQFEAILAQVVKLCNNEDCECV